MTNQPQATPIIKPTPWEVDDRRNAPLPNIRIMCGENEIAQVSSIHMRDDLSPRKWTHEQADEVDATGLANAALICKAVNCHEQLLAGCNALLGLIQLISARDDLPPQLVEALKDNHRVEEATAAIKLAESGQ